MSAYSASAPVIARTTAPSAMNATKGRSAMNASAWCGDSARRIEGPASRCGSPIAARARNHSAITGPKNRPMPPVPRCCTANSAVSTISAPGTITALGTAAATSMPSKAESTEIAGVITESPKNSAAPTTPSTSATDASRGPTPPGPCSLRSTSAVRARMPPSPWLSARMIRPM